MPSGQAKADVSPAALHVQGFRQVHPHCSFPFIHDPPEGSADLLKTPVMLWETGFKI